ncbi:Eco57I restriction-modification methylase domain-containing protein [Endothiovibrio diazotrophicus]
MFPASSQLDLRWREEIAPSRSPAVIAATERKTAAGEAGSDEAGSPRPEVVDFLLDWIGYTEERPLHRQRLLEPACGDGEFLLPIIDRLLRAWRASGDGGKPVDALGEAIRAVEGRFETHESTRKAVVRLLRQEGIPARAAAVLADRWLTCDDYLTTFRASGFDFVVGCVPLFRGESIHSALLSTYRLRYRSFHDRTDLTAPFIERSLAALAPGGSCAFIGSDRWTRRRSGAPLRRLVADRFHLQGYVELNETPAFHEEVIDAPALFLIGRGRAGATRVAHRPAIERAGLARLARAMRADAPPRPPGTLRELAYVTHGEAPWMLRSSGQMALLSRLERQLPTLEEVGCTVGAGLSTGADKAFIGRFDDLDVETECKLPLATPRDIKGGRLVWRGQGVVNPGAEDGTLVDLRRHPRLRRHLEAHQKSIADRPCAKRSPANWYRLLDPVNPGLASRPKLLIPEIKGPLVVVHEAGRLYPHHLFNYVTAEDWSLHALQAVLLSTVARLFVVAYTSESRGAPLRAQTHALRRIRLPRWTAVPTALREELAQAATNQDREACDRAAFELYQLTPEEREMLGGAEPPS